MLPGDTAGYVQRLFNINKEKPMPQLHFYENPIPLEKTKHAKLKLNRTPNFDFAAKVNSVPVAGVEFFKCSRHFPVVFIKNESDNYLPICILSLRPSGHDYGDKWEDKYIPNYIRRYPFVLSSDNLVLIDAEATQLSEEEGDPLFQEDNEASEVLKNIVTYLEQLQASYKITEEYAKVLAAQDMFEPFVPKVKLGNTTINLGELYVVSEKKLLELNETEVHEWLRKGWIAWTYAHLHSLDAIHILVNLLARNGIPPEDIQKQATNGAGAELRPDPPAN